VEIIVTVVDHFEPTGRYGPEAAVESVASWCAANEAIAGRHRDADGRAPQHTWFHRTEYANTDCVLALSDSVFRGFGEVEFHLHHGHDTHESFCAKLRDGLDLLNAAGAAITAERRPRRRFAYIAGDWSLDNGSFNDERSGCNTELTALRDAGCYADFTFPALGNRAQPRKANTLYYATDDPGPKSYDRGGAEVAVGRPASGDLLIFQGPLIVDWEHGRFEDSAVESFAPPCPSRLGAWLDANIHVAGRPEWIFVKLHTHGMQSRETFLGPGLDALFGAMVEHWNRPPFRLHFANAREAYNILKAAEAGHMDDPNDYRDFEVPPPANRLVRCDAPWRLLALAADRVALEVLRPGWATIEFARGPLRTVRGAVQRLEARFRDGMINAFDVAAEGEIEVDGAFAEGESRFPMRESSWRCETHRVA
jgi:hypothetical protein